MRMVLAIQVSYAGSKGGVVVMEVNDSGTGSSPGGLGWLRSRERCQEER